MTELEKHSPHAQDILDAMRGLIGGYASKVELKEMLRSAERSLLEVGVQLNWAIGRRGEDVDEGRIVDVKWNYAVEDALNKFDLKPANDNKIIILNMAPVLEKKDAHLSVASSKNIGEIRK